MVGPQRRRERGERAPPRRARDRALGLPRRRRAVRRDRGARARRRRAGAAPARPAPRRRSCRSRSPPTLRTRIIELEASVEMRFSQHRGEVDGRRVDDNEIQQILRESDDAAERRAAWEASKTVGAAVADDVRELARLRNEAARALGYRDWFALSVATSRDGRGAAARHARRGGRGHGRAVRALEGGARRAPRRPLRLRRRRACARGTTPTRSSRRCRPRAASTSTRTSRAPTSSSSPRRTFDGIGLETRAVLERSDLFPRDGKCQHAFCIDVDRAGDVRVLANVVPDQHWMDTMLHELGHATFDAGLDPTLPWLLRDTPPRRHRGDRDPDGPARGRSPSGSSASPGSMPPRRRRDRRARSARPAPPSCSSSRAGCS